MSRKPAAGRNGRAVYELFEHTADLGLRVEAADLDALFRDAAEGLFAMIAEGFDERRATGTREFRVEGRRRDFLLFDWLNELLYTFETRHLLLGAFEVRVGPEGLEGRAKAEPLSEDHRLLHEVKAITYHGLVVEPTASGGWRAEVIVDI